MSLPHRLGRLRRISRIGSGGFATVWLYSDPDLQSRVAVKALADNWSTRTDIRDRFLEEARILRRADSDNIVRVYDLGETEDGTPYFVMNYADRGTVADMLNAPSRSLASIADLVAQASTGLNRLHSMGILHRDVKPQNLLLSSDHSGGTRLVVADLGVAKAMLHASGITQVVGTPAYMAPEQADPTSTVDARCDVHALGAVAYHMLTGQPMRTGGMESLFSTEPIPPPSSLVPDLPASIDPVLLRAVANDPEQRWSDIAAFGTAFAEAATNTPNRMYVPPRVEADVWQPQPVPGGGSPAVSQSSPISPVPPVSPVPPPGERGTATPDRRTSNRRTGVLTGIAAVVLVALALGGALLAQSLRSDEEPSAPELSLGDGWSAPTSDGDLQWTYANESEDLELVVNTASSTDESVQDAAEEAMASLKDDGFEQQESSALDSARHGRWEKGWGLEYTGNGGDTYYWRWYFGNSTPATAGWVEIHGPRDAVEDDQQAEEQLEKARDEAILGE